MFLLISKTQGCVPLIPKEERKLLETPHEYVLWLKNQKINSNLSSVNKCDPYYCENEVTGSKMDRK